MKPNTEKKCGVCETPYFEKNNYFYGKQFTVRDLLQEQSYLNEKRQLVNRMVLGWGVVCGLGVGWDADKHEFMVEKGMALDCCGREIVVCEDQRVAFEPYEDLQKRAGDKSGEEHKFVLCLEYDSCKTEPVELPPLGCEKQERTEYNRVRDGFKLRVKAWKDACPKQPYGHVGCLDRYKYDTGEMKSDEQRTCRTKTIHEHLCDVLGKGCPECEGCDCVILATIYVEVGSPKAQGHATLTQQGQGETIPVRLDTCTDRRFVYNNALLYDLIYCHHGDLPHIVDFNWRKYSYPSREVEWERFVQLVKDGLTVYFDQEMSNDSLNRHTFFVSFLFTAKGTGSFEVRRIPLRHIYPGKEGDCYTATFVADADWVDDELLDKNSELNDGFDIEITLRGSRIWSSRGKALDGDFLADKLPTGNGTQGGDFVDWFSVMPRGRQQTKAETFKDF